MSATEATEPGKRVRVPTLVELTDQYQQSLRVLEDCRPERSAAEDVPELKALLANLKPASRSFNRYAKSLLERLSKSGAVAETRAIQIERSDVNRATSKYIAEINEDLVMQNADAASNITTVTRTSQMSQTRREAHRHDVFMELQKTKVAEKYNLEQDRLEEQEAKIKLDRKKLERQMKRGLLEAELSILSQTEEQFVDIEDEQVEHFVESEPSKESPIPERELAVESSGTYANVAPSMPLLTRLDQTATDLVADVTSGNSGVDDHAQNRPDSSRLVDNRNVTTYPNNLVFSPTFKSQNSPNQGSDVLGGGVSNFLTRKELFDKSADPFCGTGQEERFFPWAAMLENKLRGLHLTDMDQIGVLQANTSGEANLLVNTYLAAGASNPSFAVKRIWSELKKRYGTNEIVAANLKKKLDSFPNIKDSCYLGRRLRDLQDLCMVVEAHMNLVPSLSTLNYADGLQPVRDKLPEHLINRWRTFGARYKAVHEEEHPPFSKFLEFLTQVASEFSDPGFQSQTTGNATILLTNASGSDQKQTLNTSKITSTNNSNCIIHQGATHSTTQCRSFLRWEIEKRRKLMRDQSLCYRCFGDHHVANCESINECESCGSKSHHSLLHLDRTFSSTMERNQTKQAPHQNKTYDDTQGEPEKRSLCSSFCGRSSGGRSCGKTLLVDLSMGQDHSKVLRCYAIIDEQSNTTFADPLVFEHFGINQPVHRYTISTLSGHRFGQEGRLAQGPFVRGVTEKALYKLPPAFENAMIPDTTNEVATPSIVRGHRHISVYAGKFLELDADARPLLLIGRDSGEIMKTTQHGAHYPYVHRTALGWAVVGSICPQQSQHRANELIILRTSLEHPEHFSAAMSFSSHSRRALASFPCPTTDDTFESRHDDEMEGLSPEDTKFLEIIASGIHVNSKGNLEMPLPFKKGKEPLLPSNQKAVYLRTKNTLGRLKQEPKKLAECVASMGKTIKAGQVECVPDADKVVKDGRAWWIPFFPVSHPKKEKVRLVFDSSAEYHGTCLNRELLQGPDQNNRLMGVLARFREGEVGFVADVEAMFHSFFLNPEHRDYLRFYWFKDNDPKQELIQYRAKVHIFGNRPSLAIATFGLRHVSNEASEASEQTRGYLQHNFYVDDGLGCAGCPKEAIYILEEARQMLSKFNIRLHKIMSNSSEVLSAFPQSERANLVGLVDFDNSPFHRTLGVAWNTQTDEFVIQTDIPERPFTKRGVLAVVNSIFDPIGVTSPISLGGKLIQRSVIGGKDDERAQKIGWDDPLPEKFQNDWNLWLKSLNHMTTIKLSRGLWPRGFGTIKSSGIHVFADASKNAIGYCMYLRVVNLQGLVHVSFLKGDAKVAPRCATSIPRLELCAALEATLAAKQLTQELHTVPETVLYYSDSMVVLGYLKNSDRRFKRYVTRRVQLIKTSAPQANWQYISTDLNPADMATRYHDPTALAATRWISGPKFLWLEAPINPCDGQLQENKLGFLPEEEMEDLQVSVLAVQLDDIFGEWSELMKRIGKWSRLINVVLRVLNLTRMWIGQARRKLGIQTSQTTLVTRKEASMCLVREIQRFYKDEIQTLQSGVPLKPQHRLAPLDPFLDDDGFLRVGGRLRRTKFNIGIRCPIILPKEHCGVSSIIRHYHETTQHQGRHLTHGAICNAGFHVEGARKLIQKLLSSCVICQRLRGSLQVQKMADLLPDRLEMSPPFTNTGLDAFGPFTIQTGKSTRRTKSTKKVWGLLFTCLTSRAVHVETLPALDTPSFKNALRRFLALRGACRVIRSDNGSNFVGSINQDKESLDMREVQNFLNGTECQWILNPPHASHFGGVWERKIGSIRRVLEGSLAPLSSHSLSYDEFQTLLAEAMAIVNSTPLWEISSDPNNLLPLSPAMLLTGKDEPFPMIPEAYSDQDILAYGKRRWRRVQVLADEFWTRWRDGYLNTLQERQKWIAPTRSIQTGDVVLLRDKNIQRLQWPMALVHTVNPSIDGLVRKVTVAILRTKPDGTYRRSLYERPICDLVLLVPTTLPKDNV